MQYAFWIAIAVVFIAVVPSIYRAQKAKQAGPGDSGGATGSSDGGYPVGIPASGADAVCAPDASEGSWGDSCDSGGDGGGGGGGDGGGD